MARTSLTTDYQKNSVGLRSRLRVDKCFDIVEKPLEVAGRPASLFFVDGFAKDEVMEKILEFWMKAKTEEIDALDTPEAFARKYVSYVETDTEGDLSLIHI